nr:GNAT family N-acetyltransferase [Sphingomonas sp. R-74633]
MRPWAACDRTAFDSLFNTRLMMAHLGGIRSLEKMAAMFERRLHDQEHYGHCYWAAELRDTGELVGSCGIRIAHDYGAHAAVAGMPEIGWRVSEKHWGKGYAREAAEASIAWGWANLDASAIGAWTTQPNSRSWGLMERLGMTRRADLDFHHYGYPSEDPTGAMIVYLLDRPR